MNNTVTSNNDIVIRSDALAREAEWLATRDKLIAEAAQVEQVQTDADLDRSGDVQTKIGKHVRELEALRKKVTAPIDAAKKMVMDQEKELRAVLVAERDRIKALNDAYATAQAIKAEAERKRLAQVEQDRRMAEAARQAEAQKLFGEETVVEPPPPPIVAPAPPPPPKPSNNRMVKRWSYRVEHAWQIPRDYLVLDEKKVRGYIAYCEKMGTDPVVPGILFEARMSVEGR